MNTVSAHADGGPLSWVCTRWTLRSAPYRDERKFSDAHVCSVTFKHLPQPLRIHIRSFRTLGQILKIPPLSRILFGVRILLLL